MNDSDRIDAAIRRYGKTGDFGIPLDVLYELELVLDESGATIRFGSATGEHLRRRARFLERQLAPHTNTDMSSTDGWTADEQDRRRQLERGLAVAVNRSKDGPHGRLWAWAEAQGLATYVGRRDPWGRWQASTWANPFPVNKDGSNRLEVIGRYRHRLQRSPELLARIGELRGRALGCWCSPLPCHADILAQLAKRGAIL